jgi:flagellar hook protein FlgE
MSFYTSLSGLQAMQNDMSVISHNLANVATGGFKKSRTEFADVIASNVSTSPTKMVGSGVVVKANRQQFGEGTLQSTANALDLAVSGDGFFAVKTTGQQGGTAYTRNGGFQVDKQRFVVDAQGSKLQVFPVDQDGNVTAVGNDGLVDLQLPEISGTPRATSSVQLELNLSGDASIPTAAFDRNNASTYNNSTATTVYDADGNAMTMTSYYVRRTNNAGTPATSNWDVYSFVGNQALQSGGTAGPVRVTFNASGGMTVPGAPISYNAFTPAGSATPQTLALDLTGTTQLNSPFGVGSRSQDGESVGQLAGVTVDESGIVSASFSNGDTVPLGKVALAHFTTPAGLRQTGSSYWQATGVSGEAKMGTAGENGYGKLMSGTLEGSNVDITEELVALIAAQRNFQANAKALDTAAQISQSIFQIRA